MARNLEFQARQLIGKNYGVAQKTTEKLLSNLKSITTYLEKTYGLQKINDVKSKMVSSYFENMKVSGYSKATMSSHATAWREIAEATGKRNIVPRFNRELGINRDERYSPKTANIEKIDNLRQSLYDRSENLGIAHDLRHAFGLRAMESIRSSKTENINGKEYLKIEGAKGGRPRSLPVETLEQKEAVARVKLISEKQNTNGLIPPDKNLKQFYNFQKNVLTNLNATKANQANMHTLRHSFAQSLSKKGVSDKEIATALGHNREEVVKHYK
jgi:site-specific recombinase XerD